GFALGGALALCSIAEEGADALETVIAVRVSALGIRVRNRRVGVKSVNMDGVGLLEFRQHLEQSVNPPLGAAGFPLPSVAQLVGLHVAHHLALERSATLVLGDNVLLEVFLPQRAI